MDTFWRRPLRAVIFDMGGVLLPSPGRVVAGELFILLHLGRPCARGGGKEGGEEMTVCLSGCYSLSS